ncbi:MAG TPA: epoxide hydrolase [Acidimicrobiia bacterium]|nr:epoxide hydrolase [Acidimicrobiia bacterium]
MTATTPASSALVRPFTVAIADSEIDDLKQRLARTRWPNPETVPDWSQGVRLENAKSLINYWERQYDWRRFESELNAISLYWYTNSAASSARIYWENKSASPAGPKLTLPVAVTVFPRDIPRLPRSWIEDTYSNLIHYGEANKGGHFAAFEQPEILISEIRTGLRTLRS